jgi:hypothetical protein
MEALWIAIFLGAFIPIWVALMHQRRIERLIRGKKRRAERGETDMSNELIESLRGKTCDISTGSLGEGFTKVRVVEVVDNWIKIEKNDKVRLVNADYVTSVRLR